MCITTAILPRRPHIVQRRNCRNVKISPIVRQNSRKGEKATKKSGTIQTGTNQASPQAAPRAAGQERQKTREEAAGILEKDFRKAFKKGYTPKKLSMMLKNADIIIPEYLTEKFLKKEDEASPPQKEMTKAAPENNAPLLHSPL